MLISIWFPCLNTHGGFRISLNPIFFVRHLKFFNPMKNITTALLNNPFRLTTTLDGARAIYLRIHFLFKKSWQLKWKMKVNYASLYKQSQNVYNWGRSQRNQLGIESRHWNDPFKWWFKANFVVIRIRWF